MRLPFKISFKVEILALIAFAISMFTLSWQIRNYLTGAKVELVSPDQIIIANSTKVDFPSRYGGPYVHILSRLSYVNKGAVGYNATIARERIIIKIAGRQPFEHRWYRFVTTDATGPEGGILVVKKVSDARPFPVVAGSSDSHFTLFQPWPKTCNPSAKDCKSSDNYVDWNDFMKSMKTGVEISITLVADLYGSVSVTGSCTASLNENGYKNLIKFGWASPICRTN